MNKRENEKFFLVVWDQMVKSYKDPVILMEAYKTYRTCAEKLFFHLFGMDMAFCGEIARGVDPEESN